MEEGVPAPGWKAPDQLIISIPLPEKKKSCSAPVHSAVDRRPFVGTLIALFCSGKL
jgi:hypothetical protein